VNNTVGCKVFFQKKTAFKQKLGEYLPVQWPIGKRRGPTWDRLERVSKPFPERRGEAEQGFFRRRNENQPKTIQPAGNGENQKTPQKSL
jgi:hypothetical protein